jgi:lysophospholipase L1-like esterase
MNKRIVFFGDSLTEGTPGTSYFDILKKRLPEFTLVNQGRGGDTVVSLCRRIKRLNLDEPIDISFVWVGVNDMFYNVDWSSPMGESSLRQSWSELMSHFREHYGFMLEDLLSVSAKVVTVPPLFIGEDLSSIWNQKLEEIAENIKEFSTQYKNAEYFDLRAFFFSKLRGRNASASPAASANRQAQNETARKSLVDSRQPWQGELQFTIDGVHLNSAGAQIVADVFLRKIRSISTELYR